MLRCKLGVNHFFSHRLNTELVGYTYTRLAVTGVLHLLLAGKQTVYLSRNLANVLSCIDISLDKVNAGLNQGNASQCGRYWFHQFSLGTGLHIAAILARLLSPVGTEL
jgi:hypothetical protein